MRSLEKLFFNDLILRKGSDLTKDLIQKIIILKGFSTVSR
jgi:hypothetical protein